MTISIVPALLVCIFSPRWKELVEHLGQILLKTWFELDGPYRPRTSDVVNVRKPRLNSRLDHNP